jgi:hypothetical protein
MAYDETLADRIRRGVGPRADVTEKKMFGDQEVGRPGRGLRRHARRRRHEEAQEGTRE